MSNRADCDLSASWGSDEGNGGPVGSLSSEEEFHVIQYRDFMRQEDAQLSLECHKRQKRRAEEEEEERAMSGEGMACKFCTVGLACPRCEAAKRKRKQQEDEDMRPYMAPKPVQSGLPKLTLRASGTSLVQEMLKTETPMPGQMSDAQPLNLAAKSHQPQITAKTLTTVPRKLPPLRYYTTAELEAKQSAKLQSKPSTTPPKRQSPEVVYYSDMKKTNTNATPLVDVSVGLNKALNATQDTKQAPIQYTNKTLPQLASRPKGSASINLDGERIDRMATQLKFAGQASGTAMQSMLLGQSFAPLQCNTGGANATEELRNVKCHLRSCHSLYFQLLDENGLIAEATDMHNSDPTVSFIFIVPSEKALKQITERHTEETRALLAYHVMKVPTGMTLQAITDRAVFPTLMAEKDLDVEYREGDHYVGGHRLIPDRNYANYIGHIRALLDNSVAAEQAPEDAAVMDDTTEEVDVPPPDDLPPEYKPNEEATTMELTHNQNLLRAVDEHTLFTRPLKPLVKKMSMSYYKGATDLSEHYNAVSSALPVTLTVRVYRTGPLFELYQKGRLADLSRLRAHSHAEFKFDGKDQLKWEDGLQMHEYSLQASQLRRADLANGLVELRFSDPLHEACETTLLCKMDCAASKSEPGVCTYMTDNENVLLRFANGALSTVLINHASSLPYNQTSAIGNDHFFELFISEQARERFVPGMSRLVFDTLALQEGTLSKYTKKAKRYVTKKTQDTLQKGKAMKDRALAFKLVAARSPAGLQALFAQPKGTGQTGKQLQVRIFDHKMKARDAESLSNVELTKYTDPVVWYAVGDNQLYDTLQRTDNYYVHLDVDQWRGLKFNANAVTAAAQLYYADGAGDDVYVLAFEGSALSAIAKISRRSAYYKQMK